jgi:predicted methyltransferase
VITITQSHYPFIELTHLEAGFADEVQTEAEADARREACRGTAVQIAATLELVPEAEGSQ